ncbi:hypothetical protein E2562_020606 [Oryza meyeriana var. granulata]|uniref:VQ domain-containing protein n=1 Tax=Oryza meyeriana var. granulata TaxID=110450 RepID=A0A6G1DZF4_9ORYZ|nr:hypothetical protein E2562_020606 [Oryza meyeriana var. granulata]
MANRCVSLDATWAHLPAPHPTWLSPDDALTAALWASMAPSAPTGRVSKRKPRPSRRAHTTYISADPADFRRMVQEITGLPIPGAADTAYASVRSSPAPQPAELACVLPTLDTVFLGSSDARIGRLRVVLA